MAAIQIANYIGLQSVHEVVWMIPLKLAMVVFGGQKNSR